ncbi:MAG: hypothetical protein KBT27_07380 [Prevotellaceae bacterium]|nr:hypothetical protein [Candidatus Faecinaster equi]
MNDNVRILMLLLGLLASVQVSLAQRFNLFTPELKTEHPSVIYDFLEAYLYEIDSLQSKGINVEQRLRDDKVLFFKGKASSARKISYQTPCNIKNVNDNYYQVVWSDTLNRVILDLTFPMQFELLLGKSKAEIETTFRDELAKERPYLLGRVSTSLSTQDDGCLMTEPVANYYVESLNTATYLRKSDDGAMTYTFSENDKWHSLANLFQGCIDSIGGYTLLIEQQLYGFKKQQYTVTLRQWLAYCQAMKLTTYFAIEEERVDGLKALLIAQSKELGFNHMLSVIIPDNFTTNKKAVIKAKLNAYIPTQNVKDLYQQYVKTPKKHITWEK